jgi:uncharacterized protein YegJ (DUF2314 family)
MRSVLSPKNTLAMLAMLALLGCSKTESKRERLIALPVTSLMSGSIRFQYAVYILPVTHSISPISALNDALKRHEDLTAVSEVPQEPQTMLIHAYIQTDVQNRYAPPDLKYLQHFGHGISPEHIRALQRSNQALVLDFGHPKKQVWTALHTASELVEEIARKTNGLIWDEETREIFSPDAWQQKRLANWVGDVPDISSQITIHIYNNDISLRAITLGMVKIGLPDVVVTDEGWSSKSQVGNLINIFGQAMAEGNSIPQTGEFRLELRAIKNSDVREDQLKRLKPNGAGIACLTLVPGVWEEGDPKNRSIQIMSDRYPGADASAQQETMISSFFGAEDFVSHIEHNEELLAASAKAKAKLPELQRAFAAGLEPGEFIEVKAPFPTDSGGREWMWVEVTSWKDNRIVGLLENDPEEVATLRAGQKVEVRQEDVFDYLHQFPDKTSEGNTTGEIIRKMDPPRNRSSTTPIVVPTCTAN